MENSVGPKLKVEKLAADTSATCPDEKSLIQAILNVGHAEWQKNTDWDYNDMRSYVRLTYGPLAGFVVQAGKFNYQVENGGITQYIDNGYYGDEVASYHHLLISMGKEIHMKTMEAGKEVLSIWKRIENLVGRDRAAGTDFDSRTISELDKLDQRYYAVNAAWLAELEAVLANLMGSSVQGERR